MMSDGARWYRREYLQSEHWARTRAAAIERAEFCCEFCGFEPDVSKYRNADFVGRMDLNVHHLTYDRVGRELPSDLIVLCFDCHKDLHDPWLSEGVKTKLATDVARLAAQRNLEVPA